MTSSRFLLLLLLSTGNAIRTLPAIPEEAAETLGEYLYRPTSLSNDDYKSWDSNNDINNHQHRIGIPTKVEYETIPLHKSRNEIKTEIRSIHSDDSSSIRSPIEQSRRRASIYRLIAGRGNSPLVRGSQFAATMWGRGRCLRPNRPSPMFNLQNDPLVEDMIGTMDETAELGRDYASESSDKVDACGTNLFEQDRHWVFDKEKIMPLTWPATIAWFRTTHTVELNQDSNLRTERSRMLMKEFGHSGYNFETIRKQLLWLRNNAESSTKRGISKAPWSELAKALNHKDHTNVYKFLHSRRKLGAVYATTCQSWFERCAYYSAEDKDFCISTLFLLDATAYALRRPPTIKSSALYTIYHERNCRSSLNDEVFRLYQSLGEMAISSNRDDPQLETMLCKHHDLTGKLIVGIEPGIGSIKYEATIDNLLKAIENLIAIQDGLRSIFNVKEIKQILDRCDAPLGSLAFHLLKHKDLSFPPRQDTK